ncbi:MAG: translocation/assembly module TamB domain-containing protein [Polyangiaceae bacterium]
MPKQTRLRLIIAHTLHVIALVVTFALSLVAALFLNLNLPATRRFVASAVTYALGDLFEGKLVIDHIDAIGLGGVRGVRAHVLDDTGQQVIRVGGLNANAWVIGIVKSVVLGSGDIEIQIARVYIDDADVSLDQNGTDVRIARAFQPKPSTKPPTPGPSRGVRVQISEVAIAHAWVHGSLAPVPPLDVDANDVRTRVNIAAIGQATDDVRVNMGHVHLLSRNAPYNANLDGDAHADVAIPISTAGALAIGGSYHGDIAGIPAHVKGGINGRKVDAVVEVPRVEVDRVKKILPGALLADLASAHAEVHGTLDALDATAHAKIGPGVVDAKAKIVLTPIVKIDGTATIEHVDARAFVKDAPPTDVSANAQASIRLETAGIMGTFDVDVAKGMVAKTPTPAANVKGTLAPTLITATATIDEPGAPTVANARLDLNKTTIVFDTRSKVGSLQNISQLNHMLRGSADVRTHGTLNLAKSTIDADYEVVTQNFGASGVAAKQIETNGHVRGPLTTPTIDVAAHAHSVSGVGVAIETVDADATIDIGPAITVREAVVDVSTGEEHIKVKADRVIAQNGGVKVQGATIDGLGKLIGVEAEEANGLLAASVHARDIDLAKVSRVFGETKYVRSGRVSVNADVKLTHASASGQIALDLRHGCIGPIDDMQAHIDATLLGRGGMANVHFEVPQYGRIDVNTSTIKLNGSPLSATSWTEATGDAQIDGEVNLKNVTPLLPAKTISDLEGTVVIDGEIKRTDSHSAPSVELDLDTRSLVVSQAPNWTINGVDLHVAANIDEKGHAQIITNVHDKIGHIVEVNAEADLPMNELVALAPKRSTLEKTAATIDIEVPERNFESFPPIVGLQGIKGKVQATVKANGSYDAPNLTAVVRVTNLRTPTLPLTLATSGEVSATYDGKELDVIGNVVAKKKTVLALDAKANLLWRDVRTFGASFDLPWDASAHAVISSFPLQIVAPLADRGIKGAIDGEISLSNLHKDAALDAQVSFETLKVGKAVYTNCYSHATIDGKAMNAIFRIDQKDGFAEATANAGSTWGKNFFPSLDASKTVAGSLKAHNLSIAVAQPFLDDYLNQLDGRLDAGIQATIPPAGTPAVQGKLSLHDGIVQSPIIGEEFKNVSATVDIAPAGTDTIATVPSLVMNGTTGKIQATASARFHGINFAGANVIAQIPKGEEVQLTFEGQDYGEGYGNVNVAIASPKPNYMSVKVAIPNFHVTIPDLSTRGLQELTPAADIRLGVHRVGGEFTPLAIGVKQEPPAPSKGQLDIDIQMGNDVQVAVADIVKAQLTGGPHITVTNESVVTGQIKIPDGQLDVQGKQFDIQGGSTVTFNGGDPGNPDIVVSAMWPAPDGTRVYANFNGPLKTGKVTLRAEPAKTQDEILALILFGSSDEAGGQNASESSGTQAAGTAGGFATSGLTKGLNQLTGVDAQVKIDTSEANNPKPEVQVQITRTISLELATIIGAPPFGDNPDTEYATVDWRFYPRWSLATTFGNTGTSILDVLWQYRY